MQEKYIHEEEVHNLAAPQEIVPRIIELLQPKSVVDIGCGIGTFLHCFKKQGIHDVLGVDGPWVSKDLLAKHLSPEEFSERNLEQKLELDKKYDLAISLEVAEHLKETSADIFVENLVNAGNVLLFSAAIPDQGGQNHINEQWTSYWEKKFLKHDYVIHDVIKPLFWDNPNVFWWYKQNMVLVTPKTYTLPSHLTSNRLRNVIHEELFLDKVQHIKNLENKAKKYDQLIRGKTNPLNYLKYFVRSITGNMVLRKK